MTIRYENCGWNGPINLFLQTKKDAWLSSLSNHHKKCMNDLASTSQVAAWNNCYNILQEQLQRLVSTFTDASQWTIIFEYELPRERGRRPDVIILACQEIFVLEFKEYYSPSQAHIDQVASYTRDIHSYHAHSHDAIIFPLLILTRLKRNLDSKDTVTICAPHIVSDTLLRLVSKQKKNLIDPTKWLTADYHALPALVNAARTIFRHEPLPYIRRAQSAGIPQTIEVLIDVAKQAQANNELHLVLVTGVPGSGKTLVGLQFVYHDYFDKANGRRTSVFLSGNGPLTRVLQHALGGRVGRVFVQDIHGFLKQYGGGQRFLPEEHIWVYDEAQRAWDKEQVQVKRGYSLSEPMDFLQLGEKMNSWVVLVGLIGEGQEIYVGEEAGLAQWNEAIAHMKKEWYIHCSPRIANIFKEAKHVATTEHLDLTVSLRMHLAERVHEWVSLLLKGKIKSAKELSSTIFDQGFDMYISRNLDDCKQYVRERYRDDEEKRYGLLASSRAKNLNRFNVFNEYSQTKNIRIGPWYNDAPSSYSSCCQLRDVVTEFDSQGLELDFPIICWGDDLVWNSSRWNSKAQIRSKARDPHNLRLNSYRVLLTRGRDGFVVFVPEESQMDSTYQVLLSAGLHELQSTLDGGKVKGPILVTGAIIESDDTILITKRKTNDRYGSLWEFPGGTVEYGEDPKECLKREIKEELDCHINIDSLFEVSSHIYSDGTHFVILFYKCRLSYGIPKSKKHDEIRWAPLTDLTYYDFMDADKQIIEKMLSLN